MIDKIKADLICKMHYQDVYKLCYARLDHNSHNADEVTQEVFLFFQLKCNELEDKNLKGWLMSVTNLKIKEFQRALGKEEKFVPVESYDIEDESANICKMLEECNNFDIEKIDQYREIIFKHLTEREKELYQKHYIEGKSNTQIAEEMSTGYKHVGVMLSRLNKKLNTLELVLLCSFGQFIFKLFFR